MRSSALLLVLWSSWVVARDPFQPLTESLCQAQVVTPQGWRLQGILGKPTHFVAWLVSPQGKSHRLSAHSAFPVAPWQVAQVSAHELVLHAPHSCPPQQITWVIKGGFYEMDDTVAGPAAERAPAGQ